MYLVLPASVMNQGCFSHVFMLFPCLQMLMSVLYLGTPVTLTRSVSTWTGTTSASAGLSFPTVSQVGYGLIVLSISAWGWLPERRRLFAAALMDTGIHTNGNQINICLPSFKH